MLFDRSRKDSLRKRHLSEELNTEYGIRRGRGEEVSQTKETAQVRVMMGNGLSKFQELKEAYNVWNTASQEKKKRHEVRWERRASLKRHGVFISTCPSTWYIGDTQQVHGE